MRGKEIIETDFGRIRVSRSVQKTTLVFCDDRKKQVAEACGDVRKKPQCVERRVRQLASVEVGRDVKNATPGCQHVSQAEHDGEGHQRVQKSGLEDVGRFFRVRFFSIRHVGILACWKSGFLNGAGAPGHWLSLLQQWPVLWSPDAPRISVFSNGGLVSRTPNPRL